MVTMNGNPSNFPKFPKFPNRGKFRPRDIVRPSPPGASIPAALAGDTEIAVLLISPSSRAI
jgi:hypothetical protein